jgi:putative membrane protein insertion efficiency factor
MLIFIMNVLVFIYRLPRNIVLLLIRVYQKTLSFDHAFWARPESFRVCIHQPSCSEYTHQAIKKHGLAKGILMGSARVARCNPLSKGGYDPVPDKFSMKSNSKEVED